MKVQKLYAKERHCRYFIEITSVHCERLQDISDEDCLKEGIVEDDWECASDVHSHLVDSGYAYGWEDESGELVAHGTPREAFATLMNSIKKGTWEVNPYVWVYEFKLVSKR